MSNFNTGSLGGSAGDFDDSYNEKMNYSSGNDDRNDGGDNSAKSQVSPMVNSNTSKGSYEYSPVVANPISITDMFQSQNSKRFSRVSAPRPPSIGEQMSAMQRTVDRFKVGDGFEKAPVYSVDPVTNKLVMETPPQYEGTTEPKAFYGTTQVNRARDILTATGSPYYSDLAAKDDVDIGFVDGLLGKKQAGYTLSPERVPGTGIEPSEIVGDAGAVEAGFSVIGGILGGTIFGQPDFAQVKSLVSGEEGALTSFSGGLLGDRASINFGPSRPSKPPEDDDLPIPMKPMQQVAIAPRTRFRPVTIPGLTYSTFPQVRAPRAPRPARPYAAMGGYIPDMDKFSEAIRQKKKGYHFYSNGGQVYGVYPDENNPSSYKVFGGTDQEVRTAFGGAFGYEPSSIDFSKKIGDPGFGIDATPDYMKMADGGPVGFVGDSPENVSEQETVADNVEVDVRKGAFVLNAPAVEHAGSKDVQKMLEEGIAILRKRGVRISFGKENIPDDEAVGLLVSKGEVIIPPELAQVIGYDRLEKMNNRGLKEVERRQQDSPIDQQMKQVAYAATGGVQGTYTFRTLKEIDTEADKLLTNMRNMVSTRVRQMDRSKSFKELEKERANITSEVLEDYHNQLRNLQKNSDPYAFQMFQDRNTRKTMQLQNELEFGDYATEREQRLADKATTSINIPFGAGGDKLIGDTNLVGFAFPYLKDGSKVGYVAGKKTENTSPSSTARHEVGHLEFKDRQKLTPLDIGGSLFMANEEQIMRLLDLDRTKTEGLEGEYERAMKMLTENTRGSLRQSFARSLFSGRLSSKITREEVEKNLPQIIEQIQKAQNF